MNNIDIVLYINLDHRTDRREQMECELSIFKQHKAEVLRISACACPYNPPFGCTLSHIVSLKYALTNEKNENILILEDDFSFTRGSEELDFILEKFFKKDLDWDCILLSYGDNRRESHDELVSKVKMAIFTSGYLIKRKAAKELADLYQRSLGPLAIHEKHRIKYAADQIWVELMKNDKWFLFNERLGIQNFNYSDISQDFRKSLQDQEQGTRPKTFVVHDFSPPINILRTILSQGFVPFTESLNKKWFDDSYKVVIIIGTSLTKEDFPKTCFVIEDPNLHKNLTYIELLASSGYNFSKCYIEVNHGLGNQLFQIATAASYCKKNFKQLQIIPDTKNPRPYHWDSILKEYKDYLVTTLPKNFNKSHRHREPTFSYSPLPYVIEDIVLSGFFQSSRYFENILPDLKFSMPLLPKLSSNHVFVHARRGDYCIQPHLDVHGLLPDDYYRKAKDKIKETISDPIFILTSDDKDYWKNKSKVFQDENIEYYHGDPIETLTKMSTCYNFIMSNSTFAWWGIYFASINTGTDLVVAPKTWFGKNGPKDSSDIYEKNWVLV